MANTISKPTAHRIWNAHHEIELGKQILADVEKALKDGTDPTPRDCFGRRRGYSLGIPTGHASERMLDVAPRLALHVIRAHIAEMEKELAEASACARIEMEGPMAGV